MLSLACHMPLCNYPMTENSFTMIDETRKRGEKGLNRRILLGFEMALLTIVLGEK